MQAEINIGVLGHVDHGKTTLVNALTGKWTDRHSEELKRGISIRLGYADMPIYFCQKCGKYTTKKECPYCGQPTEFKRKVSFVDAPGHETLMATTIAGSSIIEGALFIIAADEKCPQPQTEEHFMVLEALKIKDIVVVQTKVDLVSRERAEESKREIEAFLKGTIAEGAPIIPVVATHGINLEYLLEAIEEYIPTPKRDESKPSRLYVSRSFDINKPGTPIDKVKGGVLGGSIMCGVIKKGEEVEIRPGLPTPNGKTKPAVITVRSLMAESEPLEVAKPGGLIAVGTDIDPAFTKSDSMIGYVIGKKGTLPDNQTTLEIEYELIKRRLKSDEVLSFVMNEPVVINVQTATTVGFITSLKKDHMVVQLKREVCVDKGSMAALSKRVGQRWRLTAWGKVL